MRKIEALVFEAPSKGKETVLVKPFNYFLDAWRYAKEVTKGNYYEVIIRDDRTGNGDYQFCKITDGKYHMM